MGLFGHKKRLNGLLEGPPAEWTSDSGGLGDSSYTPTASDYEESPGYLEGAAPAKKGFNWGRAALGFFGGPGVASALHQKDELELQQQRYAAQQGQILQAQQSAYAWAKSQGYSDVEAHAIANKPDVVASLIQQQHAPQHFGSDGGSIMERNSDGSYKTTIAPSERQIGRNVFRIGSDGTEQKVHSEIEPQAVQGVGLYGWDGTKGGIVNPQQGAGSVQPPTGGLTDEQMQALENGGAGRGPRTFRPRRFFGGY